MPVQKSTAEIAACRGEAEDGPSVSQVRTSLLQSKVVLL
jgi:hypothetical protein